MVADVGERVPVGGDDHAVPVVLPRPGGAEALTSSASRPGGVSVARPSASSSAPARSSCSTRAASFSAARPCSRGRSRSRTDESVVEPEDHGVGRERSIASRIWRSMPCSAQAGRPSGRGAGVRPGVVVAVQQRGRVDDSSSLRGRSSGAGIKLPVSQPAGGVTLRCWTGPGKVFGAGGSQPDAPKSSPTSAMFTRSKLVEGGGEPA